MDKLFDKYTVFGRFSIIAVSVIILILLIFVPHILIGSLGIILLPIGIISTILIPMVHYIINGDSEDSVLVFMLMIFFWILFGFLGTIIFELLTMVYQAIVNMLIADGWICTVGCRG